MPIWATVLIIALGGAMFLEGAVYALFPRAMKKAMLELQSMPEQNLRVVGLVLSVIGFALVVILMPKT